jgi:nucleoside phosphorylase
MSGVLLVAATEPELCGRPGLVCGIGPVEAAAATARALATDPPRAVLHVGLAGGLGLAFPAVVVGSKAVYCDLSASIPVVTSVEPDERLLAGARAALPDAPVLVIGTSAAVAGPCNSLLQAIYVEAMEGFAVLRACELAGVPAVEVRAISNEIGEADRGAWRIEDALAALDDAVERLLAVLQ